jgi:hypothetical protein
MAPRASKSSSQSFATSSPTPRPTIVTKEEIEQRAADFFLQMKSGYLEHYPYPPEDTLYTHHLAMLRHVEAQAINHHSHWNTDGLDDRITSRAHAMVQNCIIATLKQVLAEMQAQLKGE